MLTPWIEDLLHCTFANCHPCPPPSPPPLPCPTPKTPPSLQKAHPPTPQTPPSLCKRPSPHTHSPTPHLCLHRHHLAIRPVPDLILQPTSTAAPIGRKVLRPAQAVGHRPLQAGGRKGSSSSNRHAARRLATKAAQSVTGYRQTATHHEQKSVASAQETDSNTPQAQSQRQQGGQQEWARGSEQTQPLETDHAQQSAGVLAWLCAAHTTFMPKTNDSTLPSLPPPPPPLAAATAAAAVCLPAALTLPPVAWPAQ